MARMLDQTISDRLNVTPSEAAMLEKLRPATSFKPKDPAPPAPMPSEILARMIMERRERIAWVIADLGFVPPVRDMARRLAEAGLRGNHDTVDRDYKALGIESGRTRAARAEMKSKQTFSLGIGEPIQRFLYDENMIWEEDGSSLGIRTQGQLPDGRPALDEIVARGAFVHLEQMAHDHWWMGLEAGGKHFHLNFGVQDGR